MIFRPKKTERSVFSLTDDDAIGTLAFGAMDETFDDVLSRRSASELSTGTYVGNIASRRIRRIGLMLLACIFGILLFRVGQWQIVEGAAYRVIADNNRTRTKVVIPNRGVILDRNGETLAWNTPKFHLVVSVAHLPTDQLMRAKYFAELGIQFEVSHEDFEERYRHAGKDATILLADDVPYTKALAYMAERGDDPNVAVELASTRSYVTSTVPTLSHVLGFTGSIPPEDVESLRSKGYRRFDSIGKQGIEAQYETSLRGTPGVEVVEIDSTGNTKRTLKKADAIHGDNLSLTLDAEFTRAIEVILDSYLNTAEIKRAAAVVTDPSTGEILAMLSYPAYDVNMFARGITQEEYTALLEDEDAPLFPRATQGEYPAGSTMKPVYSAAALIEGLITPSTSFFSTGGLWLGSRFFPDWRSAGHGSTNVYHAIADSVNTFYYIIGGGNESFEGLGIERLMQYAGLFGLGSPSGVDLPHEADGFLPSKEWKQSTKGEPWYIGDTYNVSIGQGDLLVTPLQMNRTTATFANWGTMMSPHLALGHASVGQRIIPEDVAEVIRDGMRATVTYGSATIMRELSEAVAGKTGTAQWATGKAEHTWFTGFGPFDNPEIAVTVIVEQAGNAYYTTPIAKDIFAWWFANRARSE
jgi:penicillin-binding protein 2